MSPQSGDAHIVQVAEWTWWAGRLGGLRHRCGHCRTVVGSERGMYALNEADKRHVASAAICPNCGNATVLVMRGLGGSARLYQWPVASPAESVGALPDDVAALYREAGEAIAVGAFTASVLALRKLLMHVAVNLGAQPDDSFARYVGYLLDEGYLPPNSRGWVDRIRERSNEANHEILLMDADEAGQLLEAATLLLKIAYEFPASVPGAEPPQRSGGESHQGEDG